MGATPWPTTLRISPDGYEEGPLHAVTVQQARDLSEARLYHGEGWAASFTVRTIDANQKAALLTFYNDRKGSWDSFPFTGRDGVVRQCRFAMDALRGMRLGPTVWEYRVEVVKVGV